MQGGHLPSQEGDRALGFAAWGTALEFNTVPMRSGWGEPAQPGQSERHPKETPLLQELLLQGGNAHRDATFMSHLLMPMPLSWDLASPAYLVSVCPRVLGAAACSQPAAEAQGEGGKGMSPGQVRTRGSPRCRIQEGTATITPG